MLTCISIQDISKLYSLDATNRYKAIVYRFETVYKGQPLFIARAPGRVNIIGEHIDYYGYGVLPAAIEKDCLIAVGKNNTKTIVLNHLHADIFPSCTMSSDPETVEKYPDNYVKYVKSGYRAGTKGIPKDYLVGLYMLIEGNIPPASGVSSSSALVVCVALASLYANGGNYKTTKYEVIERCITAEREVGTASGGMDQSISVMGRNNCCLYIQFSPIRCSTVHIPEGFRFIIMDSLVKSAKLNTAVFRYNKRVCYCRLALKVLAVKLGIPKGTSEPWRILKEVQYWTKLPLTDMQPIVDTFIERKQYTAEDICHIVGEPIYVLLKDIQLSEYVIKANTHFKLWEAARHVFDEAARVLSFVDVCSSTINPSSKAILLGKLMNESQSSCRDLYYCSCPYIDEITSLALKNGALGSRLTGAGWGGCTVSLVVEKDAPSFIKKMSEHYYLNNPLLEATIKSIGIENVVFQTQPSEGACIINVASS